MKYVFPICSLLRAKVYIYKSTDQGNSTRITQLFLLWSLSEKLH